MSAEPTAVRGTGPAAAMRLFVVGGAVAYRALFNWATPPMFLATLLVAPTTQLLFFTLLGRQMGYGTDQFYIVGNAVLAVASTGVYGGAMAVGNERKFGTLANIILSSRSRALLFLGRTMPYALNGLVVAGFTLICGSLLLGDPVPVRVLPGLALVCLVGSISCAMFGLCLGSLGLWLRDIWLVANVSKSSLLLVTGVNVPRQLLPTWLQVIGAVAPITHAAAAARLIAAGQPLRAAAPEIGWELLIAVAYACLAVVLLTLFERQGRRSGSYEFT